MASDAWVALQIVGALIALVGAPVWLVWPRGWARLAPAPLRRAALSRPILTPLAVAAPTAALVSVVMCEMVFTAADPSRSLANKAIAVLLVCGIFGGLTAAALFRLFRVGVAEWAVAAPPTVTRYPAREAVSLAHARTPGYGIDWSSHSRPERHSTDRVLRNASSWLVAAGVAWYLFGRALQAVRRQSDAPGYWWAVTGILVTCGAAVWISRRVRWRQQGRTHAGHLSDSGIETVAAEFGLTSYRPAGEWVRHWAPNLFLSPTGITGPSLWPWAASGTVRGKPIFLAAQRGQVRNRTGITSTRIRTVCAARSDNLWLPHVVVAEREAVPPAERAHAIPLELEAFNRSLWAWGPDARGVTAVLHPRTMQLLLRHLPDGCQAVFSGNMVAAFTDEPTSPAHLRGLVQYVDTAAQLLPSFLTSPSR